MVVQIKSLETKDRLSRANISTIHYVKITPARSSLEKIADLLDGRVAQDSDDNFYIEIPSTINQVPVTLVVKAGDIVFRTNKNKRWQAGTVKGLKERFPDAKF